MGRIYQKLCIPYFSKPENLIALILLSTFKIKSSRSLLFLMLALKVYVVFTTFPLYISTQILIGCFGADSPPTSALI